MVEEESQTGLTEYQRLELEVDRHARSVFSQDTLPFSLSSSQDASGSLGPEPTAPSEGADPALSDDGCESEVFTASSSEGEGLEPSPSPSLSPSLSPSPFSPARASSFPSSSSSSLVTFLSVAATSPSLPCRQPVLALEASLDAEPSLALPTMMSIGADWAIPSLSCSDSPLPLPAATAYAAPSSLVPVTAALCSDFDDIDESSQPPPLPRSSPAPLPPALQSLLEEEDDIENPSSVEAPLHIPPSPPLSVSSSSSSTIVAPISSPPSHSLPSAKRSPPSASLRPPVATKRARSSRSSAPVPTAAVAVAAAADDSASDQETYFSQRVSSQHWSYYDNGEHDHDHDTDDDNDNNKHVDEKDKSVVQIENGGLVDDPLSLGLPADDTDLPSALPASQSSSSVSLPEPIPRKKRDSSRKPSSSSKTPQKAQTSQKPQKAPPDTVNDAEGERLLKPLLRMKPARIPRTAETSHVLFPGLKRGLFAGMHFVITGMMDAELEELSGRIREHGGSIIERERFEERPEAVAAILRKTCRNGEFPGSLLVAPTNSRTFKYLLSVSCSVPTLHFSYVAHCIAVAGLLDWRQYLLPLGRAILPDGPRPGWWYINPNCHPFDGRYRSLLPHSPTFDGLLLEVVGKNPEWKRHWVCLLRLNSAKVVDRLFHDEARPSDVIITDLQHSQIIQTRCIKRGIPLVSVEWAVHSIFARTALPPDYDDSFRGLDCPPSSPESTPRPLTSLE